MFSFKNSKKKPFVSVIIAAGGSSSRMNGENKLLVNIGDKPVLAHTLIAFEHCEYIDEIILSAHEDRIVEYAQLAEKYSIKKLLKVIRGGNTRLQSVYNAAIETSKRAEYLLVHDAARPLITVEEIKKVLDCVIEHNAAAASHKITDTVKKVEKCLSVETLNREELATVQTPQGGDRALLLAALKKAIEDEDGSVTDECSALEKIGIMPYMAPCSVFNIKITYPEDVFPANAIYDRRIKECE